MRREKMQRRRMWAVAGLCLLSLYVSWWCVYQLRVEQVQSELLAHGREMALACGTNESLLTVVAARARLSRLADDVRRPTCANLLRNVTHGAWTLRAPYRLHAARELDLANYLYREQAGIPHRPWRADGRCGYGNVYDRQWLGSDKIWPPVGAFCDPAGSTPCCDDALDGRCVGVSPRQPCTCARCVDTRMYRDAALSEWKVEDQRCKWINYTSQEACGVLNRLSNHRAPARIAFIGDSLIRNMFIGLELILTGEPKRGVVKSCLTAKLRKLCVGENLILQRACFDYAVATQLSEIAHRRGEICDDGRYFDANYVGFSSPSQANNVVEYVKDVQGIENTFVVLGLGLHFHCKADDVIDRVLRPALQMLQKSASTWPKLIWVHPLSVGLLKPPRFMATQGDEAIAKFALRIEQFLKLHNVPVLDFRNLTKRTRSYDGTHYGTGVNIMKAQVLLNFLSTMVE